MWINILLAVVRYIFKNPTYLLMRVRDTTRLLGSLDWPEIEDLYWFRIHNTIKNVFLIVLNRIGNAYKSVSRVIPANTFSYLILITLTIMRVGEGKDINLQNSRSTEVGDTQLKIICVRASESGSTWDSSHLESALTIFHPIPRENKRVWDACRARLVDLFINRLDFNAFR